MPPTAPLQIVRLRTRAPAAAAVPARLVAEALVGQIEPALPGLPPQCILVLRQLTLPVARRTLDHWHEGAIRLQFAALAQARLAELARQALRPALQPVGEQADAVWFGDAAELLACLARDAAAGRLQRWWWQTWLGPRRSGAADWQRAFAEQPEARPGALRWLRAWGLDAWVAQQLADGDPEVGRAAAAAGRAVPGWHPATRAADHLPAGDAGALGAGDSAGDPRAADDARGDRAVRAEARSGGLRGTSDRPREAPASQGAAASRSTPPTVPADRPPSPAAGHRPKAPSAGSVDTAGGASEEAGPGSLARHAAPASPGSAAATGELPAHGGPPSERGPSVPTGSAPGLRGEGPPTAATSSARRPVTMGADLPTGHAAPIGRRGRRTAPPTPPHPLAAVLAPLWASAGTAARGMRPAGPRAGATGHRVATAPAAAAAGDASIRPERNAAPRGTDASPRPVPTAWGGVFFLVNGLLARGWLADFTQPAHAGLPVPPWRLLAWLALRLAGPALRRDPLWSLLQALDGGPHPLPGPVRRSWRKPAAARGGPPGPHPRAAPPPRLAQRCWHALAISLREDLALSLDLPPGAAMTRLLQVPAQVWVTAGEVLVVYPLQQHPVEVRLAGLDRDPGFLPAAGRSLRFVFE